MAIFEGTAPTHRTVSIAISDVRSGVLDGYIAPESAAERLRKISKEYAALTTLDRVLSTFSTLNTEKAIWRSRLDAVMRLIEVGSDE